MVFTDFLFGMIAMQTIYLFFQYLLFRKEEVLAFFIFTIGVTSFVALLINSHNNILTQFLGYEKMYPIAFGVLFFSSGLYYRFTRFFIEAPLYHKGYNRIMQWTEALAYFTGLVFIVKIFFSNELGYLIPFGKLVFIINVPIQIYLVVYLLRTRKVLNYLIVLASLFMTTLFKAGIVPIAFENIQGLDLQRQLHLILLGLLISFMFFVFILIYNSRQRERQKYFLEMQRKEELEMQRREISNDLHDDLGSMLSGLHVYSSIALKDVQTGGDRVAYYLQKVRDGITVAMDNMSDVIWAVRNDQENEKSFSSRIKDFFIDVFDASKIECHYEIDQSTEKAITGILSRKYLLLITKEAINNAVKHSNASEVYLRLYSVDQLLNLEIEDNGIGIDELDFQRGNGLISMNERIQKLQGSLNITRSLFNGVKVTCTIPLPIIREK